MIFGYYLLAQTILKLIDSMSLKLKIKSRNSFLVRFEFKIMTITQIFSSNKRNQLYTLRIVDHDVSSTIKKLNKSAKKLLNYLSYTQNLSKNDFFCHHIHIV